MPKETNKKPDNKKQEGKKQDTKKDGKNKKHFMKDFKAELKRVIWPTPKQLFNNTVAVITVVLITAAIVFVLDFAFESLNTYGINKLKEVVEATNPETTNTVNTNTETNSEADASDTTNEVDEENANQTETTNTVAEDANSVE